MFFAFSNSFAQEKNTELDSLKQVLSKQKEDTNKLNTLNIIIIVAPDGIWENYNKQFKLLAQKLEKNKNPQIKKVAKKCYAAAINNDGYYWENNQGNLEKALLCYQQSLKIRQELKDQLEVAQSYNNIASLYQKAGNISKSIEFFKLSLSIREKLKDKTDIANSLLNLGYLYDKMGSFSIALSYYQRSLKINRQINDKRGIAGTLINIGDIYCSRLGETSVALEYYKKSLGISKIIGDKKLTADAYNSMGGVYRLQINNLKKKEGSQLETLIKSDSALYLFNQGLKLQQELGYKSGIASSLNNIGEFYESLEDYSKAGDYYLKSLATRREIGNKRDIAFSLTNLAGINYKLGKHQIAFNYANEAFLISKELGFPENIKRISNLLNELYYAKGDYKKSLEMYKLYILVRDSIQNQDVKKEMIKQQFKFEYESKATADSLILAEEHKVTEAKFEKERTQRFALYGGLFILLIFGGFTFNRFKVTQQQKLIIEHKNKEIIDSIEYAKRIQTAILPPSRIINQYLKNSFILFLPKDIVAGDFYWMEKLDNKIYFAACDCTGHGVPGAMVSVVCNNALNRAVNEFGERETGKIFDKTRELVVENFIKSDELVQDGMDSSLAMLDTSTLQLNWSGANNPLWIYRAASGTLEETKADKQPIGKTDYAKPFTTKEFQLSKGDIIYLFTDGFADQFGGENGKKLTKAKFRNFVLEISNLSMEVQKEKLFEFHKNYKGKQEQVDDICLIGVKV